MARAAGLGRDHPVRERAGDGLGAAQDLGEIHRLDVDADGARFQVGDGEDLLDELEEVLTQ